MHTDNTESTCSVPSATEVAAMTPDLAELWREYLAASEQFEASEFDPDEDPAWDRLIAARGLIYAARPTDLAGLAVQVRLLSKAVANGYPDENSALADAIADQLERLAGERLR
jgi:hypothetical protein